MMRARRSERRWRKKSRIRPPQEHTHMQIVRESVLAEPAHCGQSSTYTTVYADSTRLAPCTVRLAPVKGRAAYCAQVGRPTHGSEDNCRLRVQCV
eukprot:7731365-Pyramimonas_sp.AAC.1